MRTTNSYHRPSFLMLDTGSPQFVAGPQVSFLGQQQGLRRSGGPVTAEVYLSLIFLVR